MQTKTEFEAVENILIIATFIDLTANKMQTYKIVGQEYLVLYTCTE